MKKTLVFLVLALLFSAGAFAQYNSYRVKHGENLDSLAHKFNVSKKAILKLNPDIDQGDLQNKVIVVPHGETDKETPTSSVIRFKEYKVEKKETLYNLAKENDISIKDIKRFNPYLYNEELGENDLIRIPIFRRGKKTKNFNKSVQTSSFKNLIHVVLPKETKYGISKQYGMSVAELDSLNPDKGELQPGQVLKVKNPAVNPKTEYEFAYYEVKPKETFYSLTRRLKISRDSLESLNPILKEEGLQAGMEIKIPKDAGTIDAAGMSTQKLDLTQHLNNFSTKKIAVMLPFNLQKVKDDREKALQNDQIMRISLDLYSGVKAAIDSVQKLGIAVDAQVFDTQQNKKKVDEILNTTDFDAVQLLIGPLLSDNIQEAARKLQDKNLAILSPLTNDELRGSDKIFQTRPTGLMKQKLLITYLDSLQSGKNILILSDKKHTFFKNKLMEQFPSARLITQKKEDYLQRRDLTRLLDKNRPNWVIMATDDFGAISNAASFLNALLGPYKIRMFTADKNSIYDEEVPSQSLSNLNFTYASVDKSDTAEDPDSFVKSYLKTYGFTPNPYVVRGFDVTFDALLRLGSAHDFFESLKYTGTTEYVENKFNYHKKMLGGYYNNAVYLIKYDKDLKLKVLN